jgi:uncharacterized protein (DUF2252 family)
VKGRTVHRHRGETPPKPSAARSKAAAPPPSQAELYAMGKSLREKCPRHSHAVWKVEHGRPDPVRLLEQSNRGRLPELIPIRHGRMVRTPFTFYRGAALSMAADLATTAATGLRVQACGDCHLLNFGDYATPERRIVFDINDTDETLPAPWEWDVKRLAASFVLACRNDGFGKGTARDAVLACVRSYRERMAEYSEMPVLDVWYASLDVEKLLPTIKDKEARQRHRKMLEKARARSVLEHDFPKLAARAGKTPSIKDSPPLIYHPHAEGEEDLLTRARAALAGYRDSVQEDRRVLIDRFEIKDIAIKVVGVGSVGTFCTIVLMMASDDDPLFLQVKEARDSVLEPYAGKSIYSNHGQRVLNGYRLMQSASDIFLGWTLGHPGRHFYVRQLHDMKVGPLVDLFSPVMMVQYGELCGWALARAHARSGTPAAISGYLGGSDAFDKAVAEFAVAYADQSERDHAALRRPCARGVDVVMEGNSAPPNSHEQTFREDEGGVYAVPRRRSFFVMLQIVALIRVLMLRGTGITVSSPLQVTVAALVIGKAVLIADMLPFINRYPEKPLVYNVAWKTVIYVVVATIVHYLERLLEFSRQAGSLVAGNQKLFAEIIWPHFWAIEIILVVLILMYNAVHELVRVIGRDKAIEMFFGPPPNARV